MEFFSQKRQLRTRNENQFQMPDFRDSFTAREVCEGMLTEITVLSSGCGVRSAAVKQEESCDLVGDALRGHVLLHRRLE